MLITIMAVGSRGDVQPLVALGRGLCRRGHHVRVVAGDEFRSLVTDAALDFVPLGISMQQTMEAHSNVFRFLKSITNQVLAAGQGEHDAIISTFLGVSTCTLARERGIPFFYALQIPGLRTRAFPDPLFPPLPLGSAYNLLTHRLNEMLVQRSYNYARCLFEQPRPQYLFHFSSHLVARPADWPDFAHITGFWFLDRPDDWQPPADLEDFLSAGTPPLYVGFGSTTDGDPRQRTELILDALRQAKQRAVIVTGWGGLSEIRLPDGVYAAASLPFDWLFPRVAAAVHHGGAGTTAAALRAGIPSVVVPFGLDQPFWGRLVRQLGVGPAPIPARRLTAERLAAAMTAVVSDRGLRARAAVLGQKIGAEDGISRAAEIIERAVLER